MSSCTVSKYLDVLSHELVRYDVSTSAREAKRGQVNIYRLGNLMGALQRVRTDVGSRTSDNDVPGGNASSRTISRNRVNRLTSGGTSPTALAAEEPAPW